MVTDQDVRVKVAWATSAADFLPFTSLPKRYHGKTVALVIVEDQLTGPIADPEDVPFSLD